ncbi:MAG: hypothetical protein K9J16_15795 [Melioribacteraceae bacterium]|nr:hypothetical protein [Melioribacteraceae bacterium]MCF8356866.1 hypothetical protein [Melioribacteraceae bacterium]MCF8394877.1 hypothetical protein [Melioribacteraceae bacterium]MCF8420410.1 hypothetical protein [Melioribacteraceae bacterium]
MEKTGYIEIKVTGRKGNIELKPDTYDIKEVISIIEQAEKLIFPGEKRERPLISYKLEEGSVRNIFRTSMQAVIGFGAVLSQIQTSQNIDFLELNTAKAIESFQESAVKKDYNFEISTSLNETPKLKIDSSTNYYRATEHWSEAEFYFYGKITNAGGKDKANIHLFVEELGTVFIQTPQQFLAEREENLLYKTFGIRVKGKQNTETGEIDKSSLSFLELIDYNKKYDEIYLRNLRNKAKGWLVNINPDEWLKEIRGYDA